MSHLSALTLTAAILTVCITAFYVGGRLWERRYGRSYMFSFEQGPALIAGAGTVTVILLVVTAIVGF